MLVYEYAQSIILRERQVGMGLPYLALLHHFLISSS